MIPGYFKIDINDTVRSYNETALLDSCSALTGHSELENINDNIMFDIDQFFQWNSDVLSTVDDVINPEFPFHGMVFDPSDDSNDSYDDISKIKPMPIEFFKPESEAAEKIQENNIPPYTPDNDHCYSQPVHLFKAIQKEPLKLKIVPSHIRVKTESSASSGKYDEVDVVTVPEESKKPAVLKPSATLYKPKKSKKNTKKAPTRSRHGHVFEKALYAVTNQRTQNSKSRGTKRKFNSVETSPSSSVACSDIEDSEKRNSHNSSERKRRDAQRDALQILRMCVPELVDNTKAAKVLILNSAAKCVRQLTSDKVRLMSAAKEVISERKRHFKKIEGIRQWLLKHMFT